MLAGMPTHYHVSCRVRTIGWWNDATITEQADTVIETNGTPWAALCIWLANKDSWLRLNGAAIKSLLDSMTNGELEITGWDSHADGGMPSGRTFDWKTADIQIDEETHSLEMNGTASCGKFKFEVKVIPHDPNAVSIEETSEHTQEYTDARYLMELSERIFRIAVVHGVDQSDYEELREIAGRLDEQARMDHLNDE